MENTMYAAGYHRRSPRGNSLFEVSRVARSAVQIWHAVTGFLRALDRRMTENLDQRARDLLHGDADRGNAKRPRK